MTKFEVSRFKAQLKMALSRLINMQKKSQSVSMATRKEIGELLRVGKEDSAKVKVKHIIREDFMLEALEMLQSYCDDLLQSANLIAQTKECDESITPAAKSVIYASLRVEVPEFASIKEQLSAKFGKTFVEDALSNANKDVNPRLIVKLSVRNPDTILINRYLSTIASNFGVDWEPEEEVAQAEAQDIINFDCPPVPSNVVIPPGMGNSVNMLAATGNPATVLTFPPPGGQTIIHSQPSTPPIPTGSISPNPLAHVPSAPMPPPSPSQPPIIHPTMMSPGMNAPPLPPPYVTFATPAQQQPQHAPLPSNYPDLNLIAQLGRQNAASQHAASYAPPPSVSPASAPSAPPSMPTIRSVSLPMQPSAPPSDQANAGSNAPASISAPPSSSGSNIPDFDDLTRRFAALKNPKK